MREKTIALTGATGFLGQTLLRQAVEAGWHVRALTRRPMPQSTNISWVQGTLDDEAALAKLVAGTSAVIHMAGAVSAPSREVFADINIKGTQSLLNMVQDFGSKRFIHISSLAAREPQLADYGWSKFESEKCVAQSGLDWTIVRPTAIYGPGDKEMVSFYKMAKRGWMILPPNGAISLIHVADLSRLLLVLLKDTSNIGRTLEVDDGRDDWTHASYARLIAAGFGKRARIFHLNARQFAHIATISEAFFGSKASITQDRAKYISWPDWRTTKERHPAPTLWQAAVPDHEGIAETIADYRARGWLR
jgi:nucleoside-diphosphate-sugar epimerase